MTSSYTTRSGTPAKSVSRSSSNAPQAPSSSVGCSSPSQPASVSAALPGCSNGCDPRDDAELEAERRVEGLEHAFHDLVPACHDSGDAPLLDRQLLSRGEIDASDLEER